MSIHKRFKHYLFSLPLTEQFYFSAEETGASFHWSNWDTFCNVLGKHENFDERRKELLEEISSKTSLLKDETIWINSASKTTKSNMFDLYSLYLDARVREDFFNSEKQILYSENNSSGPFHSLSSLRWKDKETYKLFMLNKILEGSCPLRKFRLNLDLEVGLLFDKFPLRNSVAQIEQLTDHGVIMRIAGSKDFFCLSNSNRIKLKFKSDQLSGLIPNVSMGENISNDNHVEAHFSSEIIERYGNKRNFSHSREDQIYIFIGFKDLRSSPVTEHLVNYFHDILNHSKNIMEELLEDHLPALEPGIKRVS